MVSIHPPNWLMKEFFKNKRFRASTLELIDTCNIILDEYAQQGFDLSLRQLYYQLVSRDFIENSQKAYSRLGDIVSDARLAGLLDWDMIVDRGRSTQTNSHWEGPADILQAAAKSYQIDKWALQPCHVEVMVEKQALEGVLLPACQRLDVPFTANKGYSSQSFMYRKGRSLQYYREQKRKDIVVLYLGDHDPSGLDMDRDLQERLEMFTGGPVHVERLELLHAQVLQHKPPPNPAKVTDTRAKKYMSQYGQVSWELDALNPTILASLVDIAVKTYRDNELWEDAVAEEEEGRAALLEMANDYA